jgi:hypothetical protein
MTDIRTLLVSKMELCTLTGLSSNAIGRHLARNDAPRPNKRGRYPLALAVQFILARQRADKSLQSTSGLSAAKERLTTSAAERNELKLGLERGQLIKVEDHMRLYNDACLMVKTDIQALPHKIAANLAGKTAVECSELLKAEIKDCLRHLAATLPVVDHSRGNDNERKNAR